MKNRILFNDDELVHNVMQFKADGKFVSLLQALTHFKNETQLKNQENSKSYPNYRNFLKFLKRKTQL